MVSLHLIFILNSILYHFPTGTGAVTKKFAKKWTFPVFPLGVSNLFEYARLLKL